MGGAELTQQLYNSGTSNIQFNLSLTRSDLDTTLLAGFTMSFYTSVLSGNATLNYQHDSNTDHFSDASDKPDNIVGNAGLNKTIDWGPEQSMNISASYGHQVDSQSYSANLSYCLLYTSPSPRD